MGKVTLQYGRRVNRGRVPCALVSCTPLRLTARYRCRNKTSNLRQGGQVAAPSGLKQASHGKSPEFGCAYAPGGVCVNGEIFNNLVITCNPIMRA